MSINRFDKFTVHRNMFTLHVSEDFWRGDFYHVLQNHIDVIFLYE